jgi:hypothetical protein
MGPLLSRRDFLKTVSLSLSILAVTGLGPLPLRRALADNASTPRELWLLCDEAPVKIGAAAANAGSVKAFDVLAQETTQIDVPFFGHTTTQNPARPYQVATFEKWKRHGALVDLKEKTILALTEAADGNTFFGHAAYLADGAALVTSEDNYERTAGQLVLRDPSNLKVIQKMSSYGLMPHDCRAMDKGRTIMAANQGKGDHWPNISWIEAASGKLLHQVAIDLESNTVFAHLDVSPDGWLCVTGSHSPKLQPQTRIAFISPEGRVLPAKIPDEVLQKMKGEGLSVGFLGASGWAAVTIPLSNMVVLFDYKTQELAATLNLANPHGLLADLSALPDRASMIVSSGQDRDLMKISYASDKAPMVAVANAGFGGTGSHLVRLYV